MRKFLIFLIAAITATSFALAENIDKLSAGTQMFLSERSGETKLPKLKEKRLVEHDIINDTLKLMKDDNLKQMPIERKIAEVEMVNGVEMISAFVKVNGGGFSAVESMGAIMQTKFNDNLAAMLLPADEIERIAGLSNVSGIEVAEILQPVNDRQRTVTQSIDAITNSDAAKALGITNKYTGKNVILGIVDTGIDFQHIAFKDKNGNSRIVRAYKLQSANSTYLTTYSTSTQINALTYDTNAEDHGTHTSSTAGGSSVIVNGSTVTVTDDHANATYGGMAPEADLVIAGLSSLYTTSIGTAIQNICNYADQVGKPCVISLSLGSQVGPHDGTGTIASIVNQYAGNNHIIVYAAGNDGMRTYGFSGASGGMYASGTSTSSKPMLVNVQRNFSNADGNVEMLMPTITAYSRTAGVATSLKFHVVNVKTGAIVYSSNAYTSSTTISVTGTSGLAQYFQCPSSQYTNQYGDAGKIRIIRTQDSSNNKYYWQIYAPIMLSTSYSDSDGDGIYNSDYAFCVSVYPTSTSSSTIIDMWENYASWFGTDLNLNSSSYNYCPGNDECSVSDNACYSKVISVGAYVTKNSITDYNGITHDFSEEYPNIGDHASFSSWQAAGYGPLGTALPHINAPGARIVAGVNHYHTVSVDDYSYYGDDYKIDLVVNSASYPYAAMEGTSMATPCVSGIIAQWLQACVEAGKTPSPDYIKDVMAATWDTDQWTNGAGHGAKTFGTHGKINAIKGIQYILGCSSGPLITASPESLSFTGNTDHTYTETVTVTGTNLQGNVSATISGTNSSMFSVLPQTITQSAAASGATVTVTYSPTAAGTHTANLVLTSTGAESVSVPLSGTAVTLVPTIVVDKYSLSMNSKVNESVTQTFNVKGENLTGDIAVDFTINDNNAFTKNITNVTVTQAQSNNGVNVTVTFNPHTLGTHNGRIRLRSSGATDIYVNIEGTVLEPFIMADPETLEFQSKLNGTDTKTFTVMAENLVGPVTATLADANGVFAVNTTSIAVDEAESQNGYNVTVTFNPSNENITEYTGTVTLSSSYAQSVVVNFNGKVMPPVISIDNDAIEIWSGIGRSATATFTINGQYLVGDITATLETDEGDEDGFTIDKENISIQEAESADGCVITITFHPTDDHLYYGGVTLSSPGAEDVWVVFTGKIIEPTLAADESLSINSRLNGSKTESFSLMGECLAGPVSLSLYDDNGVFTLNQTTISIEDVETEDGFSVPVTFAPKAFVDGYYSATITLSTPYHEDETVELKGYVNVPQLTAAPEALNFTGDINTLLSKNIEVLGFDLIGNVSVTLDDPSGVFSVSAADIPIADVEATANVSVTFNAASEGTYIGSVTFSTDGVYNVVVSLSATANEGGTASDAYLNIAKYSTIDDAGWRTSLVDNIYKYKEYEDQDVAWLTLPVYGAFVGARYATNSSTVGSGHPQAWIECTLGTNNTYGGTSWVSEVSYTNPFNGSSSYFINTTSRAIGYNSRSNTSIRTVSFYVTNTTEVKLYGTGRSGASSNYPARLRVYECTKNANGTLTTSTTAVSNQTSSSTSTFTLSANGLDVTKIYKVETSIYRGYLYEVAFCTPLPRKVTLAQIVNDPSVVVGKEYRIIDEDLTGAYLSEDFKYLYCKDNNGYANPVTKDANQIDFIYNHGWQTTDWDQSNWIALGLTNGTDLTEDLTGYKLTGIRGILTSKVNPTMVVPKLPSRTGSKNIINLNNYLATNFDPNMLAETGNYFFVPAKPMEVVNIWWAEWDEANSRFVVAEPVNNSIGRIDGSFYADFSKYNDPSNPCASTIENGGVYNFIGFGMVNEKNVNSTIMGVSLLDDATSTSLVVFPLANWERKDKNEDGTITEIKSIFGDGYREIVGVEYVNVAGMVSDKPFQGINIVVTRYSDGSATTVKTVKKVFK